MSANTPTAEATTEAERTKRKLDPYRGFVRKVLQRTAMTTAEAKRRDGESLESMLDRVVAAVDETIEKARAPSAEPDETPAETKPEEEVEKIKKKTPGPPRLSERPVVWDPVHGRLYSNNSKNWHPDSWHQDFPSYAHPLKCGLEVWLPGCQRRAIIAGFNPSMPQNKVMMIFKSAAQMPLDYCVQEHEIRSFTIRGVIRNLVHLPDRIPPPAPAKI